MAFKRHKRYSKTTYDGNTVNWLTRAALETAEEDFGARFNVSQGSYTDAFGPSAGTHGGGGVVDIITGDIRKACRALANVGFAAFHRPHGWDGADGIEHIHACLKGDADMAALAKLQAQGFDDHRDGLGAPPFGVYHGYVPDKPVTFDYDKWVARQRRISDLAAKIRRLTRQRERLTAQLQEAKKRLRNAKH